MSSSATAGVATLQRISAKALSDKMLAQAVVFHCALSQQRGPSAALRYLRERGDVLAALGIDAAPPQVVYVLHRGFSGWQKAYGEDERLTEAYRKELWQDDW
ncbi:phosphoprotein phosphatase-like protein [Ophiocordyceps sinensis CO18]|uniref:Phosphoprotein phosphatase-like protein n=1 Tax=Ophiocordyceps sinensis (strain Co18 / CGMCC 3.14243) TaxID=911162 RepID=T5AE40_OPHSC|nr:phosphoprotein phosphatase-like protein [Ophiocordyceps sinensis CO18]